jgi:ribose/xylose/arabinose/galactoside ABC-type transport system permease subunit
MQKDHVELKSMKSTEVKSSTFVEQGKRFANRHQRLLVLIVIFVLAVIVSPVSRKGHLIFLTPGNLTDLVRSMAPAAVMGFAMTMVIITAGIDLSVGSTVAVSGVLVAMLLQTWKPDLSIPVQIAIALAAGLVSGALIGLVQGVIIAYFNIQPFIVTLAGMIGLRGVARWLVNNERVGLGLGDDVAGKFGNWFSSKEFMLGSFLVTAIIFGILLHKTVFGRYVRAVGGNVQAARYAGLPTRGVQIAVYTLMGLMAGFAGILMTARTTCGDPNNGISMELDVISVAAIGGTSLAGGLGTIPGTVIGALIVGMLTNILGLKNVDFNIQKMIMAVIIILAVASQRRQKEA